MVGLLPQFCGEFLEVFCPQKILREVDIEPGLEVEVLLLLGVDFLKIEMLSEIDEVVAVSLHLQALEPSQVLNESWMHPMFAVIQWIFSTEHRMCPF